MGKSNIILFKKTYKYTRSHPILFSFKIITNTITDVFQLHYHDRIDARSDGACSKNEGGLTWTDNSSLKTN